MNFICTVLNLNVIGFSNVLHTQKAVLMYNLFFYYLHYKINLN